MALKTVTYDWSDHNMIQWALVGVTDSYQAILVITDSMKEL